MVKKVSTYSPNDYRDYLEHGNWRNHKYLMKIGQGATARYFYTMDEIRAWKNKMVKKAKKTGKEIKKTGSKIGKYLYPTSPKQESGDTSAPKEPTWTSNASTTTSSSSDKKKSTKKKTKSKTKKKSSGSSKKSSGGSSGRSSSGSSRKSSGSSRSSKKKSTKKKTKKKTKKNTKPTIVRETVVDKDAGKPVTTPAPVKSYIDTMLDKGYIIDPLTGSWYKSKKKLKHDAMTITEKRIHRQITK